MLQKDEAAPLFVYTMSQVQICVCTRICTWRMYIIELLSEMVFENNIQTSRDLQKSTCNQFVNVLFSNYSNGNVTGNNTETVSDNLTGV